MLLFVKELNGKTYSVEVELADDIYTIKNLISEKTGMSIESQRLVLNGKEVYDENIIGDLYKKYGRDIGIVLIRRNKVKLPEPPVISRLQLYPFDSIHEKIKLNKIVNYHFPETYDYLTNSPNTIGVFNASNGNTYYVELIRDSIEDDVIYPPEIQDF